MVRLMYILVQNRKDGKMESGKSESEKKKIRMKIFFFLVCCLISCHFQETLSRKLLRQKNEAQTLKVSKQQIEIAAKAADPVFLGVMKSVYVFDNKKSLKHTHIHTCNL